MNNLLKKMMAGGLLLTAAGCADLTVPNVNDPDAEGALTDPTAVQGIVGGNFRTIWNAQQWFDGTALMLSTMSWEHGASWGNQGMWQMSRYPREELPNNEGWAYYDAIQYPWTQAYATIIPTKEVLKKLAEGNRIVTARGEDITAMVGAFAHFMLGYAHATLAVQYDRAFIVNEETDVEAVELSPYGEVMDAAMSEFQKAIDIASENDFITPDSWINGNPLSSQQLARLAHSMMARYMAEGARTPAERAAVNWNSVISHVDAGLQSDFHVTQNGDNWWDDVKVYGDVLDTWSRANYHFWGQADISGGYEAWMAATPDSRTPFTIITPDKRYPQGATATEQAASPGLYLTRTTAGAFRPNRGPYYFSFYRNARYDYYGAAEWKAATPMVLMSEMRLLKAEGLYRTGNLAGAAALINVTRVGNGGLPPVTAAGVPGDASSCVPQLPSGACGSLFDALKYEKRVENVHTHLGTWFFDSRGWGDLPTGTPIMFPVPARELALLGLTPYTYGGVGGNCAAGSTCVPVTADASASISSLKRMAPSRRATLGVPQS